MKSDSYYFKTTEMTELFDATVRQLQTWHEYGWAPANLMGHQRRYSVEQAVMVGIVAQLRLTGNRRDFRTWLTKIKSSKCTFFLVNTAGGYMSAKSRALVFSTWQTWSGDGHFSMLIDIDSLRDRVKGKA